MTTTSFGRRTTLAVLFVLSFWGTRVFAQNPSQTWTPAATCTNGLPTPTASNGTYLDAFGATWAVQCAQDNTGFSYDQYEGTNGHGVYACFLGCDNRPGCTAFMYQGTVSGKIASYSPSMPLLTYWRRREHGFGEVLLQILVRHILQQLHRLR